MTEPPPAAPVGAAGPDGQYAERGLELAQQIMTHALRAGSPAVDAADDSLAPATDQRGETRPDPTGSQNDCDIGAFELTGLPPATPTPSAFST